MTYLELCKEFISLDKEDKSIMKNEKLKLLKTRLSELDTSLINFTQEELDLFFKIPNNPFNKNSFPDKQDIIKRINNIIYQKNFSFAKIYGKVFSIKDNNKEDNITEEAYDILFKLQKQVKYCSGISSQLEWDKIRQKPIFNNGKLISQKCTMPRTPRRENLITLTRYINNLLEKNKSRIENIKKKRIKNQKK